MKKFVAGLLAFCMMAGLVTACGKKEDGAVETVEKKDTVKTDDGKIVINLWSFTDEVPKMVDKYIELHPEFGEKYEVKVSITPTTDGAYQPALDTALTGGGADSPDMFCAEAAFVLKYTQGDMSMYAAPYSDLGIDVDKDIADAQIAPYSVDIGTRTADGKVVALGYQATGGLSSIEDPSLRMYSVQMIQQLSLMRLVLVHRTGISSMRQLLSSRRMVHQSSLVTVISGTLSRTALRLVG